MAQKIEGKKSILVERIKNLMEERGVLIKELAEYTDLPYTTIMNILTGVSVYPSSRTLLALSHYFNTSIDYMLGVEDDHGGMQVVETYSGSKDDVQHIPILPWKYIKIWISDQKKTIDLCTSMDWVYSSTIFPPLTFALEVPDNSYKFVFQKGDVLIITPFNKYEVGDYVISFVDMAMPVIRKLAKEGGDLYLEAITAKLLALKLDKPYVIYGKVIKYIRTL